MSAQMWCTHSCRKYLNECTPFSGVSLWKGQRTDSTEITLGYQKFLHLVLSLEVK